MGHHIDDKTAPGKTHSLTDGGTGKFLVAVFSSWNQTETQVWALKGPGQCSDSDRSRIAWQLVSHTLGCTLSFIGRVNVTLLCGLLTWLLPWASEKIGIFRWRSVQRGQGGSQMPRLLLGPQCSISTSLRASQDSSRDIVYRMNPAVSSSSEWEGAGMRRESWV